MAEGTVRGHSHITSTFEGGRVGVFVFQNLLTVVDGRRGGWVYKSENVDVLLTVGGEGGLKGKML